MEIQTYSSTCGILYVYGVFFCRELSNLIFCKMSKRFYGGSIFVFEWKQSKLQKQTLSTTNFSAECSPSQTWQRNVTAG